MRLLRRTDLDCSGDVVPAPKQGSYPQASKVHDADCRLSRHLPGRNGAEPTAAMPSNISKACVSAWRQAQHLAAVCLRLCDTQSASTERRSKHESACWHLGEVLQLACQLLLGQWAAAAAEAELLMLSLLHLPQHPAAAAAAAAELSLLFLLGWPDPLVAAAAVAALAAAS